MLDNKTIITTLLCLPMVIAGCENRSETVDEDIHPPTIAQQDPGYPQPNIEFPSDRRVDNEQVNQFVLDALNICAQGDYDGFRGLFGTSHQPAGKPKFEKLWHNVKDIVVVGLIAAPTEPPSYYLHAKVQLRKEDPQQRLERDAIVKIFQEAGQWRLGPADKEAKSLILQANAASLERGKNQAP